MFFKQKYTKTITANYTGTTMSLRNGKFFINCELVVDDCKYLFVSKPLYADPQEFIKKFNIKEFKVLLKEKNGQILYDKYLVDISNIENLIDQKFSSEE